MAANDSNESTFPKLNIEIRNDLDQPSGLYGRVYQGWQADVDRMVAVKVMKNDWPGAANALEHAKVLARVDSHENIVSVYEVGTVEISDEEKTAKLKTDFEAFVSRRADLVLAALGRLCDGHQLSIADVFEVVVE